MASLTPSADRAEQPEAGYIDEPAVASGAGDAAQGTPLKFSQRHWVSAVLILGDVVVLELCVGISSLIRQLLVPWFPVGFSLGEANSGGALMSEQYFGVMAGVLALPVVYALMGLYPGYGCDGAERLRKRVVATTAIFFTLIGWDYLVQDGRWSRGVLLITWFMATFTLPVMTAAIISFLLRAKLWGTPVLVMGPPEAARATVRNLKAFPRIGLVPVGYVASRENHESPHEVGVPTVGTMRGVNAFANRVKTVMLVNPASYGERLPHIVAGLAFPHVILVPEFTGMQSLWVTTRDLGGTNGLEIKKNLLISHNRLIKRTMDIVIAGPLFVLALPVLAFLCLMIFLVSPGRPFYAQVREGEGGKRFAMLKLRTMYPDAEARLKTYLKESPEARQEWSLYYKLRHDPRILPFLGSFLRKSSLDELPQLWHVLRGDMSLVGPRPFPHYHLEGFNADFRALRRSVRPGLTGLWQVEARSDGDLGVQEKLDTFYIRNWSIWLDFHILMRTFAAVVRGGGAR